MIGNGTKGGFSVISVRIYSGALPPGVGSTNTARPSQTAMAPSQAHSQGCCVRLRAQVIAVPPSG